MIQPKDLKDFRACFHRNGVGGEPFVACSFRFRGQDFRAAVFDAAGAVAVIGEDLAGRCRGDEFEDALRSRIEQVPFRELYGEKETTGA